MGKNRSRKKKSSVRSELLANEAEHRQSVEETYTKPIHPGQDLAEFKEFLSIFYKHVYRHDGELKKLVRQNSVIGKHYERLVPRQISHEDFFQRYLYRCDKQRVFQWEKRQSLKEQENGTAGTLSSSLLHDAAEVQVREALRTSERDMKAEPPIVADDSDEVQTEEIGKPGTAVEDRTLETQAKGEAKVKETGQSKASVSDDEVKLPGLSSLESTSVASDDGCSDINRILPPEHSFSGKDRAVFLKFCLFFVGLIMVLSLLVYSTPADNPIKVAVSDTICVDLPSNDDTMLLWWSPKKWIAHSELCARQTSEPVIVVDGQGREEHTQRPWSALANKVRWHRRRTQNYHVSNGAVIKQLVDEDQNLHKEAAPLWSLQRWKSDQHNAIAQNQQGDNSAISPWSTLAEKIRGRGWKSKSWGTTDSGDVVYEEQKVHVTTEGQSTSSQGTELVTSQKQAYIKTVVTEVKKTTIYTPVQ